MAKFTDLNLLSVGHTINLVGAVYAGEGKMYLCLFPGEAGNLYSGEGLVCFQAPEDVGERETVVEALSMDRDEWAQFLRQTDILETEIFQKAKDGKLTKAIVRKSARQISQQVSWAVFRRDEYTCRYCGKNDVPLTVDHLVTWEECGPSTEENLVASCKKCNKTRGNTSFPDWLKSNFYKRVSKGLSPLVLQENVELQAKLDAIPRMVHKPTKR